MMKLGDRAVVKTAELGGSGKIVVVVVVVNA